MRHLSLWARASLLLLSLSILALAGSCKREEAAPAAAESATPVGDEPKLEFEGKSHDFGTVDEGEQLRHVFKLKNTGGAPLLIDRVRTSCGCAAATPDKKEIAPGGTSQIEVKFDTRNRQGRQRKTITVMSNDPESPHTLEIHANVTALLAFQPRHVQLTTSHGEALTREAWLFGKLAAQAKPEITTVDGDELDGRKVVTIELAKQQEGDQAKQGLRFTVKADKVGFGRGSVEVKTGVEQVPTLKLWFNWNVSGNLQGIPRNLYFSGQGPGGSTRTVRVRSKRADFKLLNARVLEGPFKAEIEKPDAGTGSQVRVTVTAPQSDTGSAKPTTGKLEIVTNDPLEPRKTVGLTLRPYRGPQGRGPRGMPRPPRPPGARRMPGRRGPPAPPGGP
jgi:hypothetical protein